MEIVWLQPTKKCLGTTHTSCVILLSFLLLSFTFGLFFFFFNKNTLWLNETESVLLINHPILGVNNPNQLYSLCFIFSRKPNISYGEWKSQPLKLLRLHSTFGHKFKVTSSPYNLSLFLLFMHRTPPNRCLMKIFFFTFPIINCIF